MRRDQLKSAYNKPLPKNRESSMTLFDDLKLLTNQALEIRDRHPENRIRNITVRPLNSIDGDTAPNKALWVLSSKFAALKGA